MRKVIVCLQKLGRFNSVNSLPSISPFITQKLKAINHVTPSRDNAAVLYELKAGILVFLFLKL